MSKEDTERIISKLLLPRYEVMTPYPGSVYQEGEVLYASEGCLFDQFPKVFRLMKWWEKQELEDIKKVNYLKYISLSTGQYKYIKVRSWVFGDYFNHKEQFVANGCVCMGDGCYEPAAEREYHQYITMAAGLSSKKF